MTKRLLFLLLLGVGLVGVGCDLIEEDDEDPTDASDAGLMPGDALVDSDSGIVANTTNTGPDSSALCVLAATGEEIERGSALPITFEILALNDHTEVWFERTSDDWEMLPVETSIQVALFCDQVSALKFRTTGPQLVQVVVRAKNPSHELTWRLESQSDGGDRLGSQEWFEATSATLNLVPSSVLVVEVGVPSELVEIRVQN